MLVLGGTTEGAALARALSGRERLRVVSSLAGATRSPAPLPGEVRVGGFGGVDGLARYLREQGVGAVVDATHPYAATISRHAAEACAARGVPRVQLVRAPWEPGPGDRWHAAPDLAGAARALPGLGERVFLATGLRGLAAFAALPGTWFLLRAVDPPRAAVPLARHALVLARGPFREPDERALLEAHRIDAVVSRNAGGSGARAKLDAARALGLPVVMVSRPEPAPGPRVPDVAGALAWLAASVPA